MSTNTPMLTEFIVVLSGLYHPNALMTMSSNFTGIADHKAKNLNFYIEKSRSFIRTVNPKPLHDLFEGPTQIVKLFGEIGNTEHDFKSFTIDLISYTVSVFTIIQQNAQNSQIQSMVQPTRAVITVNGVFKETAKSLNEEDLILGFHRTFIISRHAINQVYTWDSKNSPDKK